MGGGGRRKRGETIKNLDGDRKLRPFVCRKFHFPERPFSRRLSKETDDSIVERAHE
jgi:hypothetical protein